MTIGLPRALLYYRYGTMWEYFFRALGHDVLVSGVTDQKILSDGIRLSVGESCLPAKVYLGHVASLVGHCDRVFVPRCESFAPGQEFCVRFWGLPDLVRGSFPGAPLLGYNYRGHKKGSELLGFLRMGSILGANPARSVLAYREARRAQDERDAFLQEEQESLFKTDSLKILLAAHPYVIHDCMIGGPLVRIIRQKGGVPIFADRCDRDLCRLMSADISSDLYWTMNREIIGAIPAYKGKIDGTLMVTAFPCGTDSLACELALRRIRGIPIAQILLDEQQGEAGLETRVECFMDMLAEKKRKKRHAS